MLKQKRKREKLSRDLDRIDEIEKEIIQRENELKKRREMREEKKLQNLNKPKQMGPFKFEEEPIDLLLPNEMPKRLLHIPGKVNPLKGQLKSFQRRSLIEVRYKQQGRKPTKIRIVDKRYND